MRFLHLGCLLLMLAFGSGCEDPLPLLDRVWATPDSVPRGGVAYLQARARGPASFRWQPVHGTVLPDTGDSTVYYAPQSDVDDTVRVTVRDERGRAAEGQVVIHVREGLCGGRPLPLVSTNARLLVADSARVYHAEPAGSGSAIRRVSFDGVERDTLATRPHEIRRLAGGGGALYWLERDPEPRWLVMTMPKDGTAQPSLFLEYPGLSASVADIAVTPAQVHVAWLETVGDTGYVARITSYPRTGGPGQERFALAGPRSAGTAVRRLVADRDELFFLVTSNDPELVAVMKLPATGEPVTLAGPDLLAPGTLAPEDGLRVVGDDVFWSEQEQGRIGRVGRDGSGAGFLLPAGGDAQGVSLLEAAAGPGAAGTRVFWAVPDDLRGMIVETGAVLRGLARGSGDILGLTHHGPYLFFVRREGVADGRLYRLLIP